MPLKAQTPDGQLCPYDDCAHGLAIPHEGWYICEHCHRVFFARVSDSDFEDYFCYRMNDECAPNMGADVAYPLVAKDLGPSWGTPHP